MTRIAILDDEIIICETLLKHLVELGYEDPVYALDYEEGRQMFAKEKIDLLLLDINLGKGKSGIDFARYVRQHHNIPIVFISSYSDKSTVESVKEVQPNGYLVKPFSRESLYAAIETAMSSFTGPKAGEGDVKLVQDALFIKQDALYIKVLFSEILYIRAEGVYAEIITASKKWLIRETMKHLMDILPDGEFFQPHRSYIVNIHKIEAVNSEYVLIAKEHIPISRTNRDEFLSKLNII